MTTSELTERLEALGYLFVTVVGDNELTAVDPQGYQTELKIDGNAVVDRRVGSNFWDITFIDGESFL